MKRLIKKADMAEDISNVNTIFDRIDEASNNLKDIYYSLFDNLNALYESYPEIYEQMKMIVNLPDNSDAENIVSFNNDLHMALEHFRDPAYLESYLKDGVE